MKIMKSFKYTALIAFVLSLAVGCAAQPTQEQTAAEQAVQEAKSAHETAVANGYGNDKAGELVTQAESALEAKDWGEALNLANESKQYTAASKAIFDAKAAIERAKAAGADTGDAADLLAQAEQALAEGRTADAIQLANQARRQAENALAQMGAKEPAAEEPVTTGAETYTVQRGDSLWHISGRGDVYGNPYQWPLIYKANTDKINDADLIYPGQNLTIDRSASSAEIDAAVRHARTRGAWSLGTVEESDRAYLAR